jgi:hypothetical protein
MLKNKKKPLKILIFFFKKAIQKNKIKNKTRWPGLLKKPKCLDLYELLLYMMVFGRTERLVGLAVFGAIDIFCIHRRIKIM